MTKSVVILAVLVLAVFALATKGRRSAAAVDAPWPFYAKKPLTSPEQVLYFRLLRAFPEHIVLAQVALSRILGVKKGNNFSRWFNRINRMTADFILCAKDATILAVIELDDSSHGKAGRRDADARKDKALQSAGISVVRWNVKSMPDEDTMRSILTPAQSVAISRSDSAATAER
jgi:very-short-patch-repair endonuclease